MSNQKLIRVKNGDQSTSLFTTDFNPPILVPQSSSIALQNLSMKLRPNLVNIQSPVNKFSYATVQTSAVSYPALIAEHTSTIPDKIYTITELIDTVNILGNSKLYYSGSPTHTKEQGAELLFNLDKTTNKMTFHYVARKEDEFNAPDPTSIVSGGYTYTTSTPAGKAYTVGNVLRGQANVTKFDTYLSTTNVFCRGSGALRFRDFSSGYRFPGVWSGGNTFTTDDDLTIALSGLTVGEIINFITAGNKEIQALAQGGGNGNKLVITMTSLYTYTGVWSGGNTFTTDDDLSIADSGFTVGENIYFEGALFKEIQGLAQGGGGGNKLVITMTTGGVADGADTLRQGVPDGPDELTDSSLTAGYVVGLIEASALKLTSPDDILSAITYGVMVQNKDNTYTNPDTSPTYRPGVYYTKRGTNAPWATNNIVPNNTPTVKMELGRRESPNDQYKLRVTETDTADNTTMEIDEIDYTYGNYVMIVGIMKDTSVLNNIRWTASKITKGTSNDGYYSTYAPDISSRQNNFVDVANALPDENLEFFGASSGYIVLDWLNLETASVFGYYEQQNTSSDIKNSSTLTVVIPANTPLNAQYGFPESIIVKLDLPLESYDQGKEEHIIAFVPNIVTNDKSNLIYSPSPPTYINLKNASPLYLDHLTVRLENEDNQLLDNQESCSVILLISSK
jgi:hypothetical protein